MRRHLSNEHSTGFGTSYLRLGTLATLLRFELMSSAALNFRLTLTILAIIANVIFI